MRTNLGVRQPPISTLSVGFKRCEWVVLDLAATWMYQWSGAYVHLFGNQGYHEIYIRSFSKAAGSLKLGKNAH